MEVNPHPFDRHYTPKQVFLGIPWGFVSVEDFEVVETQNYLHSHHFLPPFEDFDEIRVRTPRCFQYYLISSPRSCNWCLAPLQELLI